MAVPSIPAEKLTSRRSKQGAEPQSQVRTLRLQRGLTQEELATLSGMHRNSISKLERGATKEITAENASALAAALETTVPRLGLRVRATVEARSVRFRRLTPEQRQIVDDLLSLPPESFTLVREAIEKLRMQRSKKRVAGARK